MEAGFTKADSKGALDKFYGDEHKAWTYLIEYDGDEVEADETKISK